MAQFSDLVILIPGITGSVLVDAAGDEVWAPSAGTVWSVIASGGRTVEGLALGSDDENDGITASRLVPDVTVIPGLVKIQGYSRLANYLVEELNLVAGENFHEFPYDWRRDIRHAARQLQKKASVWLHLWREKPGNENARLVLIGHSMGGLVARYFVECLEGWQDTRTMITLGTPHRGSLNALDFLEHGMKKHIGPFGLDLSPVLRSMTSLYQLLPIYRCIKVNAEQSMSVVTAAKKRLLTNIDVIRATEARAFHQEIQDAQAANALLENYASNRPRLVTFVGIEQPTAQSAILTANGLKLVNAFEGNDHGGDGTVPRISATLDQNQAEFSVYASDMHGALQNAVGTLVNIKGILTEPDIDIRKFLSGAHQASLTLDMDDVVMPGETMHLRVRRSNGNAPVSAEIVNLGDLTSVAGKLSRDGGTDWQRGEFQLGHGTWRVTVRSDNAAPVSDIVVVVQP